ncbi:MAG: 6-phosphogluconolactonase [Xanthobacteraceae bacterium]|nr:6-phosphogluconolactonase [Xanthobacteraceae bacterium]
MLHMLAASVLAAMVVMTTANAATLVYVGNAESNDIDVMLLDPQNGDLSPVQKVAIPGVSKAGSSTPMAVSPDKRFLYIGVRSEPLLAATFAIDGATGRLSHVGNGPLPDQMAYLATDRTGLYLLGASYGGHKVAINQVGPDGVVEAAHQVVATAPNAHQIITDPSNRFVLVTSLGADIVNLYKFDVATGFIANDPGFVKVPDKAGPRHFVFHPNGTLVYLLNELDGSLVVFAFDGDKGTLAAKQTVSALPPGFAGKPWAADIHLTPDGKLLYASERTTSTLAGFKVDAAGMLTPVGSVATEQQPRSFAIDPSGRYLLAVGQLSHSLTSHAVDAASGKLTALKRYPTGQNPNWVEIVALP